MATLLQTLISEHRSIAAVLHGMRYLLREKRDRGAQVDPRIFGAMLYYLDVFPERMHHPKEETYLFQAVRRRTGAVDAALAELGREHASGERAIRELEHLLLRYTEGGDAEFQAFAAMAEHFIDGYFEHMRKEEEIVLPAAREALSADDWQEIEAAFQSNRDPLAGIGDEEDQRKLFTRIVNLAPPPIGVGNPL